MNAVYTAKSGNKKKIWPIQFIVIMARPAVA